jgi:hypothetical protein
LVNFLAAPPISRWKNKSLCFRQPCLMLYAPRSVVLTAWVWAVYDVILMASLLCLSFWYIYCKVSIWCVELMFYMYDEQ